MIEIKRNAADDIRARAEEMNHDAFALKGEWQELFEDAKLVEYAARVSHIYSVLTGNGVPEDIAKLIAVTYKV